MSRPTELALPAGIDPQLADALQRNQALVTELGPPAADIAEVRAQFLAARRWWNEGGPVLAVDRDDEVSLASGRAVQVAVYAAQASRELRPAYVFLHGGGFRLGSPRSSDRQLRELATHWSGVVVSVDYAHMPEAVFPTAVEETAEVLHWLHAQGARWGIDPARLAIGGSSAGANVALGAAVQSGLQGSGFLQAGAFVVGVFDDDLDTPSMRAHGAGPLAPTRQSSRAMFTAYAGLPQQREDPRFNVRHADLSRMPPLFLAAAELDIYRDSSLELARRLRQAGRVVQAPIYPGMTHLFWGYSRMVDTAHRCTRELAAFLDWHLPAPR